MSLQIFTLYISRYGSGSHLCAVPPCPPQMFHRPPPSLHHGTKVRNWAPGIAPQCVCYGCYGTTARAWGKLGDGTEIESGNRHELWRCG